MTIIRLTRCAIQSILPEKKKKKKKPDSLLVLIIYNPRPSSKECLLVLCISHSQFSPSPLPFRTNQLYYLQLYLSLLFTSSTCGFLHIMPLMVERRAPGQSRQMHTRFINGYILYCIWSNYDRSKTSVTCTLEEERLSTIVRIGVVREREGAQRKGHSQKRGGTRRELGRRPIFRQAEEEPTEVQFLSITNEKITCPIIFP